MTVDDMIHRLKGMAALMGATGLATVVYDTQGRIGVQVGHPNETQWFHGDDIEVLLEQAQAWIDARPSPAALAAMRFKARLSEALKAGEAAKVTEDALGPVRAALEALDA